MNEAVDVIFGSGLNDTLDTVDIDIVVREIPAQLLAVIRAGQSFLVNSLSRILTANKVIDNVGMADTFLDRLGVPQVVFL